MRVALIFTTETTPGIRRQIVPDPHTMPIITEVRFAHEDGALADTLTSHPEIIVSVIREASTHPKQSVYLLQFDNQTSHDIASILDDDHTVKDVMPMPGFEDQQLWGVEFADDTKLLAPKVTSEDGFVLDARSTGSGDKLLGWHERWLLPDRESLHSVWQHARDEDFEFEVADFRKQGRTDPEYPGADAPTDEQRETLIAAFEQGYFAEPRETSLEELAETLDISTTAAGGRLKRGMKSLIGMTLVVDDTTR